jgi:thioesterase domain-containing protein
MQVTWLGRDQGAHAADLDLSLVAQESEQALHLSLSYRADLFDESTIAKMLDHFQAILEAAVAAPERPISQLLADRVPQFPDRRASPGAWPAPASAGAKAPYAAPRTDAQRQLASIWARLLGVDRVGIDDDFFQLGGTSLLAVRVINQIRAALGVSLAVADFFLEPTVAAIARHVSFADCCAMNGAAAEIHGPVNAAACLPLPSNGNGRSLTLLRAGAAASPLFCVHGLGGHVGAFMPLAKRLSPKRPVYALQAQGLDAGQRPHDRIEDMAAFYLHEIRQVQPRGPYLLAGWSLGGLIALAAAQQLHLAGEPVALVAMLDTYLSLPDDEELDPDDQAVIRWIAPLLNLSMDELKALPLDRQWELISERAGAAEGIGIAEIRRLAATCTAHLAACARYRPQRYDGSVVLFAAERRRNGLDPQWKPLCPRLRVEPVPGNHYSLLREPAVDVLAGRMEHYLARTAGLDESMRSR